MVTYVFEKNKGEPLYRQLYEFLRNDIISGVLAGGTKLPSKRAFADHLGVSKVTVEGAYSLLISEGYVYSLAKKGYFVEDSVDIKPHAAGKAHASVKEEESKKYAVDLSSNTVPPGQFPFSVWSKLMRNVCLDYRDELLLPMPYNGAENLRESIAEFLFEQRGMNVLPSQIIIGSGSEYFYSVIVRMLGNDLIYAVEDPCYRRIALSYAQNGVERVPVPIDKGGIITEKLKELNPDVLHISPSHNFPTGTVTGPRRRKEILNAFFGANGKYIIEDDFDSELRFNGKPIPTLYSSDPESRVIYMNTFSKTLAPSIRISYMVVPSSLAERCRSVVSAGGCPVSSFEQYTLAGFISKGYFERHLNRNRKYYKCLRDSLISAYKDNPISKLSEIEESDAGLHFFIKLYTDMDDEKVKTGLENAGIKVSFLSDYVACPSKETQHRLLVNYSGLTVDGFLTAADKICDIISSH